MSIRLTNPGIYDSISEAEYHADPCPEPSLSGSLAVDLLTRTPRHAWEAHPRLNPEFEREEEQKFDLGTACHTMLFGRGKKIVVLDYDSFRTKAAQEERDAAYAVGNIPMLARDNERVEAMTNAALDFMRDAGVPFDGMLRERALIWQEKSGIWCRGLVDATTPPIDLVLDYKTSSYTSEPLALEARLFNSHWHVKAAMYERGLNVLSPESAGRRRWQYLCQETRKPYACSLIELTEAGLEWGRRALAEAIETWTTCMAAQKWPAYSTRPHLAQVPGWLEARWLAREEFQSRAGSGPIAATRDWQAPPAAADYLDDVEFS